MKCETRTPRVHGLLLDYTHSAHSRTHPHTNHSKPLTLHLNAMRFVYLHTNTHTHNTRAHYAHTHDLRHHPLFTHNHHTESYSNVCAALCVYTRFCAHISDNNLRPLSSRCTRKAHPFVAYSYLIKINCGVPHRNVEIQRICVYRVCCELRVCVCVYD